MPLPNRVIYTLTEAAARWNCHIADIAEWAMSGQLDITIAIPPTCFGAEIISDLVVIAPGDILAMFRRCGTGPREGVIRRVRMPGGGEWKHIPLSDAGLRVTRDDLLIQAGTLARFEEEHGVFRRVNSNPTKSYDWEGFYGALILRIFQHGLPEKQGDLVGEMLDWFIAHSTDGDAPDESTVRKRVSPILRMLNAEA